MNNSSGFYFLENELLGRAEFHGPAHNRFYSVKYWDRRELGSSRWTEPHAITHAEYEELRRGEVSSEAVVQYLDNSHNSPT